MFSFVKIDEIQIPEPFIDLSHEKYLNIRNYEQTFIIPYIKKKIGKCLETSCS